jgi:uroporphyrinogen decarboxylase
MYHFTHRVSPLRHASSLPQIEAFSFPAVSDYNMDHFAGVVEEAHADGKFVSCWVGHMYEEAWQARGYEEFLMDMLTAPEHCEYILDRYCERNTAIARAAAAAGVDLMRTGDDVANQNALMFSIDRWRHFMKSRWSKVYAAAREIKPDIQIWYHSDGNVSDIVPELIEIGVTVLNPVQPECMDVLDLKKRYGGSLVFDGTVGTQTTMPFGTPDDVRSVIRERKRTIGADGALIISPTHVLEPEVTPENVEAFLDEARRTAL